MLSAKILITIAVAAVVKAETTTNPWATYPAVPKTASINGFADPVYSQVAECAQKCLDENADTGSTPCPYWDTGCLCVMQNWSGAVAQCVAESCSGDAVQTFTQVASAQCSTVGAPSPYWFIPDSAATALAEAASNGGDATTTDAATTEATTEGTTEATTEATTEETTSAPPTTEAPTTTSTAAATSEAAEEAAEEATTEATTEAAASSAAASSAAPEVASSASSAAEETPVVTQANGANVAAGAVSFAAVVAAVAAFV